MAALYDNIGKEYDITRKADPEITVRLKNHLQVSENSQIIDIACGTGNYTVALANLGLKMTGVDISEEMINQARQKSTEITWHQADATNLPFTSNSFQGATCTLAIHHFPNLSVPFEEVHRVLGDGRFVLFTSSPEQMERYWLTEYFPKAMQDSCQQMPKLSHVIETLKQVGFSIVGVETFLIQPDLQDFFLYSGKYEPEMYLDPKVRSGISTFASLASQEDIEVGCNRLKNDIQSGRIHDILGNYSSDLGDYMFVIAEKKTR